MAQTRSFASFQANPQKRGLASRPKGELVEKFHVKPLACPLVMYRFMWHDWHRWMHSLNRRLYFCGQAEKGS